MSNEELSEAIKILLNHRFECLVNNQMFSTTLSNHLDKLLLEQLKRIQHK